jgi:sterol carrier protein 2
VFNINTIFSVFVMQTKVLVAGVGMTPFVKPGKGGEDYPDFAALSMERALADADIQYSDIQSVFCGYVYGDSTCGQRAVYRVGISGVPIVNVNNNCSTGSSALYLARQAILAGQADCVLVVGFEKMTPGSLATVFTDRANPLAPHIEAMERSYPIAPGVPFAPQLFGNAGREHMKRFGTTPEQVAKIAVKNHSHSKNNPYAQFRDKYSLEQVLKSPTVYHPLTKLQCCPTSDGAAAAILVSESFARRKGLLNECVEIAAMALTTDVSKDTFESSQPDPLDIVGYSMAKNAAKIAFKQAGIQPKDIRVAEVHDCFSANELITYEALGFCDPGQAGKCIDTNDFTYGGRIVVNPSGGLISKGHPLGATGLAQCAELVWQLRGHADKRQVAPMPQYSLQHNLGLGGACVVSIYRKYNGAQPVKALTSDPSKLLEWEKQGRNAHSRPVAQVPHQNSRL